MSAIDDLDLENGVVAQDKARGIVESRDAGEVVAARHARWNGVVPEGLTGKQRDELESTLDFAQFVLNKQRDDLWSRLYAISEKVAADLGKEPDDPAVARKTALAFNREILREAETRDVYAGCTDEQRRSLAQTCALARAVGWSPQQIAAGYQSALLQAEGNKSLAIGYFSANVQVDGKQRGFHGQVSLDDALLPGEQPEFPAYKDDAMITVEGRGAVPLVDLREDIAEREERYRRADDRVAALSVYAAETLKPADYAVFRVMLENADLIDPDGRSRARGKYVKNGQEVAEEDRRKPLTEVVQEKLGLSNRGALDALARVQERLAAARDVLDTTTTPNDRATARMGMSADVLAEKVRNRERGTRDALDF